MAKNRDAEYLKSIIDSVQTHSRAGNLAKLGSNLLTDQMVKECKSKAVVDGAKQARLD